MRGILFVIVAIFLSGVSACIEKVEPDDAVVGGYLGQAPPTDSAVIFAPGIVCTGLNERDFTMSPDGNEIYYSLYAPERSTILRLARVDGRWVGPEVAPFSGRFSDTEAFIAPDGQTLYFASNRPRDEGAEAEDYDIWLCDRTDSGWGEPYNLGAPVNTEADEFYPSVTGDGTLYFTAVYDRGLGKDDIYRAAYENGVYAAPELLGSGVNTAGYEYNAFVAPDESYLIFTAYGREGAVGSGDLYISFRDDDGRWGEAINLGTDINSAGHEMCPWVSRDGNILVFTSSKGSDELTPGKPFTYRQLTGILDGPGNGNRDIYWMNADIITSLTGD